MYITAQKYVGVLDLDGLNGGLDGLDQVWVQVTSSDLYDQASDDDAAKLVAGLVPINGRIELDDDASGPLVFAYAALENGARITHRETVYPGQGLPLELTGLSWEGVISIHKADAADTGRIVLGYP